jgi:hypothetical protein
VAGTLPVDSIKDIGHKLSKYSAYQPPNAEARTRQYDPVMLGK